MTDDQKPQTDGSDGMDSADNANRRPSRAKYSVIAVIAAAAGFVGVYMGLQSTGNEKMPSATEAAKTAPAKTTTSTTSRSNGATGVSATLKKYAKGHMGTFVVKKTPTAVSDKLKFMDYTTGDDSGVPVTIANWKGKVLLLNLWATWCAPCRKEMPDLLKLKQDFGGADFDLVPVSIDRGGPTKPRKFLNQINAQDLGLYQGPSSETAGPLKAFGMPTTVLFDRQGREIGRLVGPADWASDEAKALIKAAIDATG